MADDIPDRRAEHFPMIDVKEQSVRLGDFLDTEDVHLVLAKIAHLVNHPEFRRRLDELLSADEFFQLLADAGV
jgi:mannitol/fructose-specific phosphotransferase system IIA component (Ntr-type)